MKSRRPTLLGNGSSPFLISLVAAMTAGHPAYAATVIWDGGPATTGTDIGTAENWTGDVLPSAATPDTAQWNGTPAGPLSLVYSNALLAGVAGNTGLNLDITAAQTSAVSLDSGSNTSSLRINNINLAAGSGSLTLGNGTDTFAITLGGAASTQTFTNASSNTVTVNSDVVFGLGGGGNHLLNFTGSGNWSVASNLAFAAGGQAALYKTGTGTLTLSGGAAFKEGATVNGAAIFGAVLKEGTTIFNGGTYTNNITTNNGEFVVGGLDTVGTNTQVTLNNATILNGIDWVSIGRGNGTGATTSNLTLNNTSSITPVNMSLGFNGGNAACTPKGTLTLNDASVLTVSTTSNIAESAGSNFTIQTNGTSALTLANTVNIAQSANTTAFIELNGTSTVKQTANSNQTRIGMADGAVGTLHLNGGTATFERDLVFGYAGTGTGRLTLDSGTLNVANATERWLKVNDTVGSKGELTINGGNINLNTNTDIRFSTSAAAAGTSFVTLNAGAITGFTGNNNAVLSGASVIDLNQASTSGTINNSFNLNGGTLTIGQIITSQDSGTVAFNFNGGTLKAAANSANFLDLGGANQSAKILAGGAKVDTNGVNVTIPQSLVSGVSGDGGLTKLGTGILTLSGGASSYTGATTVSAGTLNVPSGLFFSWGSGIGINGTGAKLTSNGIISVPVTLTSGAIDAAGAIDNLTVANNATNSLTAGNGSAAQLVSVSLAFQGAAALTVVANGTTMDRNFATTNLATNAAGLITVNATNATGVWTSGTNYPVIEYSGTFTGSLAHFTLGTIPGLNPNQTAQIINTGSAIAIRITGESLIWTGTQSADWTTAAVGGSKNWSYLSNGIEFSTNSPVIFNDNASRLTVNLASNVNPSTVVFNNDLDYTLSSTGSFGITAGTLTKNGFGKLTIATNNTYTGTTQINQGTVEVTGSIGTSSTITIVSGAELLLNPASAKTYGNALAGAGVVRKQGTAALTLSGASTTFTGDFHLEAGTLNLNSAGALGTGPGIFEIAGGVIDNTSGAAVTLTGAKPQQWNADFTFTGTNDLALGTGAVTLGGTGTARTVNVAAGNLGSGPITSAFYDLVKTGAGGLRLSGAASNLQGKVDIQAGIIGMGEDILATGLTGSGILENNTPNTKWGYWNITTDQSTGTLIRDGAGVGRTGIVKRGAANWTLTNNSNFATGNLNVENGKLVLNNTGTYGATGPAGAVITNLTSVVGSTAAANGILEINGATLDYHTVNNADAVAFRGSLTIATNGTGAGAVRLNSGSLTTYRQLAAGGVNGAYGAYTQTGGTTNVGGFLALGLGTGSGVFVQTGGIYNQTISPITNGAGTGSNGVMRLTGSAVFNVSGTGDNGLWLGEAGTGRLSVSGNAALNIAVGNNGLQLGRVAAGVGIANLLGGNVTTPAVTKGAGTGTLNFNGGTLTANTASATFLTGLTNAYVHAGGGTIANGGNNITIGQALLAPTGNGVSATGLIPSGSGFIAPPVVQITGDGTGATAVAEVDASGNLTGITVTNPGIGYTTPPVFSLVGGGIGNTGTIGGEATLVANSSGALTFTGTGTTILSAQNTYTGNTVVNSGTTLAIVSSGSLAFKPAANHVSNKVTGAGLASFDGTFNIDLTGAAVANGNTWTLVDVASKSYSVVTFNIPGFTEVSNVWTKVDGNNTWSFSESTGVLSLAVSGGSGNFASWVSGFGLAAGDQDPTDDPDGDGISNFIEYALGGNPSVRELALLPTGSKSGSNFVLSFSRSDLAVTNGDAPLAIEYGSNLTGWTTVAVPAASGTVSGVTFSVTNGSPNDAITAAIPTGSGARLYARVKAGN
ncbi:beta strand repeat-containing protein [Luteolibacter soli]|uniref:Autotransporter-associated beta strand repeat-containing protein n=1 Tax=Luteolibacter soli TaxID=3135280 RepID=A0ABU9AUL9_9BACT